ncbi:type II secretion system F family protein [Nocardioides sp. 31GB23]|uniref:type II secretion system F family protein n=1 Tax=Nocardioides sp. 31GB23 TaxID=3156065 RepID=UPI0032AED521
MREAKAAAEAFVAAAADDVRIGLLTFAGSSEVVVAPTTDRARLAAAIEDISLDRGTRLYDALHAAVDLTGDAGARSVVVLSDGRDQGGGRSADDVVAAVVERSVVVDVVALGPAVRNPRELTEIASASGGGLARVSRPASLRAVFERGARSLSSQLVVEASVPHGTGGEVSVVVSLVAGGETYADATAVRLAAPAPDQQSIPTAAVTGPAPDRTVLLGGAAAVGLGIALTLGLVLSSPAGTGADRRLATYFREGAPPSRVAGIRGPAVLVAQALVPGDLEARMARRLAGAGLALRPAEWVLLRLGVVGGLALLGLVAGGPPLVVALVAVGLVGPALYLRVRHVRRLRAFGSQLPDTLTMIANSLSAGLSVAQAIDSVVRDGQEPIAGEMLRALMEHRLGVDVEDAIDGVAARMGSTDFAWVAMAIRVQKEVGGNLAEVLVTVADTLREREHLRRQVRSLSAEGRLSAYILGGLPVALFGYMMLANRDFVRPLYTEVLGAAMLGAAVVLLTIGGWSMSRLVKVEV